MQMHVFLHKYCDDDDNNADDKCSGKVGVTLLQVWLPINKCFRLSASLPAFLFNLPCRSLLHLTFGIWHCIALNCSRLPSPVPHLSVINFVLGGWYVTPLNGDSHKALLHCNFLRLLKCVFQGDTIDEDQNVQCNRKTLSLICIELNCTFWIVMHWGLVCIALVFYLHCNVCLVAQINMNFC